MRWLFLAMLMGCGGGPDPILAGVPQPKTSTVAGAAAAVAGAATLADPKGQQARVDEANKPDATDKPIKSGPSVPADVLDRLDEQQQDPDPEPPPSEQRPDKKAKKAPVQAAPKSKPTPIHPPKGSNPLNP